MALHDWWLYATAVFLISATPGPNMLHVMVRAIDVGPRRAGFTVAGLLSGILLYLCASAAGLGAVLKTMPGLFNVLRFAGAAYLLYLGWKAWTSPVAGSEAAVPSTRTDHANGRLFRAGLFTTLSNPKFIVFAAALFPQFIDPAAPIGRQMAILLSTFIVIESFWYAIYALGGARLAVWLRPARRQKAFNRATGGMFAMFGALLLARPG